MKPIFHSKSRRQFLMGTGGAMLALPLLPSLLPKEVRAQATNVSASDRFFVHMTSYHGVYQSQFFGSLLDLTPQKQSYAGIDVRSAPLQTSAQSNMIGFSDIVRADASKLTPRILSLMNVINGLDFANGGGHNRGGPLGGDSANPTIDQVLAASKTFYPNGAHTPAIVRNLVSLTKTSSGISATPQTAESNTKLFDRLFQTTTAPEQMILVDRVREHANLVLSDPQCSADCKLRFNEYLDNLASIQNGLNAQAGTTSMPRPITETLVLERSAGFYGTPAQQIKCEQLWNDIVVAAFSAGLSRVYVAGPNDYTFGPESEHPWHNNYAHGLADASKRATFSAALQMQFEGAMIDIAQKLDAVTTADGKTLLDKAVIASGHELGSGGTPDNHHNRCIPIISIGSAGGYFKTGQYADYRDLNSFSWSTGQDKWYSGLLYNQWMGMILRAMGLKSADYSQANGDWGYPAVRGANGDHTDAMWNAAQQDLPFIKS
jgi:hypothetical protein